MLATQVLRKEHDAILKMLDALDSTSRQLKTGGAVPQSTLEGMLEFFQLFADRCHHGKEENLLFPLLERKGMPRSGGPIGVMLSEHDHGRELIREMSDAASEYGTNPVPSAKRWVAAAENYSALLREHILKENDVLFRFAEKMLTSDEQTCLAAEFEKAEVEKMGAGTHERLHARMEEVIAETGKAATAVR